jgi:hypothetical protein
VVDERRQRHREHAEHRRCHDTHSRHQQDKQDGRPKLATSGDVVLVDALGHGLVGAPLIDEATATFAVAARGRLPEVSSIARASQTT